MSWSLSEFFGLLEIRSQCWCLVELGEEGGFTVRHSDEILFYTLLDGSLRVVNALGAEKSLAQGDTVMIVNGDSHAVRVRPLNQVESFEFLNTDSYADALPAFRFGAGATAARVLCARLRVRWPFGQKPTTLPAVLSVPDAESVVKFVDIARIADTEGAAALLTRAASLLFCMAFRASPECDALFQSACEYDPITRSKEIIEKHPFKHWTVESLARKVGMGRSSFAARFVLDTGVTPIDYLTDLRMKHASELLEKTDLKISVIGKEIGYRSEAAFVRRFSYYYSCSPGRVRKQMRGKNHGS